MSDRQGLIVIPARLASTRLPNKLLLTATGKPLLAHVIERAQQAVARSAGRLVDVAVACDHPQLAHIAERAGVRGVMTSPDHRCGTTRIAEAVIGLRRQGVLGAAVDFVVNVQGDEPELAPEAILTVVDCLLHNPAADMATLVVPMGIGTDAMKQNPAAVKAIVDSTGRALYFSRAPIPFDRQPPKPGAVLWRLHLGIYAYRLEFLREYAAMAPSVLEEREGLEQLRAVEAGRSIMAAEVPLAWAGKGIDTPEDYAAFVSRHAA